MDIDLVKRNLEMYIEYELKQGRYPEAERLTLECIESLQSQLDKAKEENEKLKDEPKRKDCTTCKHRGEGIYCNKLKTIVDRSYKCIDWESKK